MSKPKTEITEDPFFGLKFIAYHRSILPTELSEITQEVISNYAKWQICKARNVLWNDPIWDSYTDEEIMVEFFAIMFDENVKSRDEFGQEITMGSEDMHNWFDSMAKKHSKGKTDKIDEGQAKPEPPKEPTDFEDKF